MLMHLVMNNTNPRFRDYLLGASFDKDEDKFVFGKASKPRVNIDAQDLTKRTALHYAIEPCSKFAGKGYRMDSSSIHSLIKAGAKTSLKDSKGQSSLDLAR